MLDLLCGASSSFTTTANVNDIDLGVARVPPILRNLRICMTTVAQHQWYMTSSRMLSNL